MAAEICQEFVADPGKLSRQRSKVEEQRDQRHENTLLLQQYLLLYEELTYEMNVGDIGRVESCFLPWIWIFHGCGKHKYAAEMKRYLENVHFHYPKELR